jgi:hypothetical protein
MPDKKIKNKYMSWAGGILRTAFEKFCGKKKKKKEIEIEN